MTDHTQQTSPPERERVWACDGCNFISRDESRARSHEQHPFARRHTGRKHVCISYVPKAHADELAERLEELREAINEHREQGLRDSFEHGDALDYVARSQENDKHLYAALSPTPANPEEDR